MSFRVNLFTHYSTRRVVSAIFLRPSCRLLHPDYLLQRSKQKQNGEESNRDVVDRNEQISLPANFKKLTSIEMLKEKKKLCMEKKKSQDAEKKLKNGASFAERRKNRTKHLSRRFVCVALKEPRQEQSALSTKRGGSSGCPKKARTK